MDKTKLYLPLVLAFGAISLAVIAILIIRGIERPQNAVTSKAAGVDASQCQGNPTASAKCFKCETGNNKNNPIGILDFSCFAKYYGKTVGTSRRANLPNF